MHNVLPHSHYSDLSEEEYNEVHTAAENILDYLDLLFHNDMGEGHLEYFESSQDLDCELSARSAVIPPIGLVTNTIDLRLIELLISSHTHCFPEKPFPDLRYFSDLSLRGPPIFS